MNMKEERPRKEIKYLSIDDLVSLGFLKENEKELIVNYLNLGRNIILFGTIGTGKTVFLRTLISQIPKDKKITIVQSYDELMLKDDNITNISLNEDLNTVVQESIGNKDLDYLIFSESNVVLDMVSNFMKDGVTLIASMHAPNIDYVIEELKSKFDTSLLKDNNISLLQVKTTDTGKRKLTGIFDVVYNGKNLETKSVID